MAITRSVIIVGAGPAGMALGYLLARRGIEVTVLESHRDFARVFRGEGLQLSGIDAIRQMGLGDRLDRIPYVEARMIEMYARGQRVLRTDAARMGRANVRLVSQPLLLEAIAEAAGAFPSFHLVRGEAVRELIRENERIVGVRVGAGEASHEYRADLVIGSDGRHAITRKQSGLAELSSPQSFDILWFKIPYTEAYPDRCTAMVDIGDLRIGLAFPTADDHLQAGFIIRKGTFNELRGRGADVWTEELISGLPDFLADQLRKHREAVAGATLLDVVCGRLVDWSVPGLLLIGDAAHPMSPVGGQGVNIALRDALVAANHLVPALLGGDAAAIDAAAKQVRDERWPEIVAAQDMQQHQARMMFAPDNWRGRMMYRMIPLMMRLGVLQRLNRKEYRLMSQGVVPVKLAV